MGIVEEFAEKNGFAGVEDKKFVWRGYNVYLLHRPDLRPEDGDALVVGYPAFALEKDGEVRGAKIPEEASAILRAMPDEDEEEE